MSLFSNRSKRPLTLVSIRTDGRPVIMRCVINGSNRPVRGVAYKIYATKGSDIWAKSPGGGRVLAVTLPNGHALDIGQSFTVSNIEVE